MMPVQHRVISASNYALVSLQLGKTLGGVGSIIRSRQTILGAQSRRPNSTCPTRHEHMCTRCDANSASLEAFRRAEVCRRRATGWNEKGTCARLGVHAYTLRSWNTLPTRHRHRPAFKLDMACQSWAFRSCTRPRPILGNNFPCFSSPHRPLTSL